MPFKKSESSRREGQLISTCKQMTFALRIGREDNIWELRELDWSLSPAAAKQSGLRRGFHLSGPQFAHLYIKKVDPFQPRLLEHLFDGQRPVLPPIHLQVRCL